MTSTPLIDPLYVAARRVLLDAVEALTDHRDAIVVIGAQAIYLHTSDADLDAAVAPYTTDGDLALDPALLAAEPKLAAAMGAAGFTLKIKGAGGIEPGSWLAQVSVEGELRRIPVDLIVPGALAIGHGRRDARLSGQGEHAARWAGGLEAAMVDNIAMTVASLDSDGDPRTVDIRVAGVPALLIAKCYKIHERLNDPTTRPHRIRSKDAGDVIRLMRGPVGANAIGTRLAEISADAVAGQSVQIGVEYLRELFAAPAAQGVRLAANALAGALDEEQIRVLAPAFVAGTLAAYDAAVVR